MKYIRVRICAVFGVLVLQLLSLTNFIAGDIPYIYCLLLTASWFFYDGIYSCSSDTRSSQLQERPTHNLDVNSKMSSYWTGNRLTLRVFYLFIAEYLLFAVIYSRKTLPVEYRMQMLLFAIFLVPALKIVSRYYLGKNILCSKRITGSIAMSMCPFVCLYVCVSVCR